MERLLGRWVGAGTVLPKGVQYEEELVLSAFTTPKGTCYQLHSQTWRAGNQRQNPMHSEVGMVRQLPTRQLELLLTHPFGLAEVSTGGNEGDHYNFETIALTRTPSARPPFTTGFRRHYWLEGAALRYEMFLRVEGGDYVKHLEATLNPQVQG